jgi:hypothetical protein
MYQRALEGLEKVHGPTHVFVLGTVNNIGVWFAESGEHKKSKQMYHQALQGFRRACEEHFNTVMVINNLNQLELGVSEHQPTNIVKGTLKQPRRRWYW